MRDDRRDRPRDNVLATLMRTDPEKLAALRRIASGTTRCPLCDAVNRADQERCSKCGGRLYLDGKEDEGQEEAKRPG